MAILATVYANRKAEGGKPNRARIMLDLSEAKALRDGDKEVLKALRDALKEALPK